MKRTAESISHINLHVGGSGIVYIPVKNKIHLYKNVENIENNGKISEIAYEDEILNFHILEGKELKELKGKDSNSIGNSDNDLSSAENIVIVAKSNKKVTLMKNKGELITEYSHYKKITNSLLIEENCTNYLLFSDKFGEIYIMNITQTPFNIPKILYGHSDPIHLMKISPFNNTIISADIFGKIKVCEFPNIFNLISVILYKSEDIKSLDFMNNTELIVLTADNVVDLWDLQTQELKSKLKLEEGNNVAELGQEIAGEVVGEVNEMVILSVTPVLNGNLVFVESERGYYLYEKKEGLLVIREKIEKIKKVENDEKKLISFILEDKNYAGIVRIIQIDEEGVLVNIITRKI